MSILFADKKEQLKLLLFLCLSKIMNNTYQKSKVFVWKSNTDFLQVSRKYCVLLIIDRKGNDITFFDYVEK